MNTRRTTWMAIAVAIAASMLASTVRADTTIIRFNDYDGGATFDPAYSFVALAGAGAATPAQGFAGLGVGSNLFAGNMFRNAEGNPTQGSGGTFTNLPLGGSLSFSFLFAAIDSWDGLGQSGPDNFEVLINGSVVFTTSIDNFPPPASITNGGSVLASDRNLGFSTFFDSAWDFTNVSGLQNIGYSGTSATYLFRASGSGWQGGTDESWGLDNFVVSLTTPIPEPSSYALMLAGLVAVGCMTRRRRV